MSLLIFEEDTGELAAFDCKLCLERYKEWRYDPAYPYQKAEKAQVGVSFGCFWCGGDLTDGLDIQWLE